MELLVRLARHERDLWVLVIVLLHRGCQVLVKSVRCDIVIEKVLSINDAPVIFLFA